MELDMPVSQLPFRFALLGTPDEIFINDNRYLLDIRVLSNAGNKLKVGDLINETIITIHEPTENLTIEVTGLENCTLPGSGGFCINPEN